MNDDAVKPGVERADVAWARLARDLHEMGEVGETVVEQGKTLLRRSLPFVGIGFLGLLVIGGLLSRRARPKSTLLSQSTLLARRERSLLSEMLRSALISTAGVVASRLASQLPLALIQLPPPRPEAKPELPEKTELRAKVRGLQPQ